MATADSIARAEVRGKFVLVGDRKLWIKGVTYGTFRPDADGLQFPVASVVERDLAQMASSGPNTVRTCTARSRWLLDAAGRHGLRAMVGLPWEQQVTFLDDFAILERIEGSVRAGIRQSEGHPALLRLTIGKKTPRASCAGTGGAPWRLSSSACSSLSKKQIRRRW